MTERPVRPLLIYDGDCGFCRRWIARWQALTGPRVEYAPFQQVASQFPEIPPERFREAVQLIESDGTISGGAEAVFRTLAYVPGRGWLLWMYQRIPGFSPVAQRIYRFVAGHRGQLGPTTSCPTEQASNHHLTCWVFLKILGLIYLIAFASLLPQVDGLIGKNGIFPVQEFLVAVRAHVGLERYWLLPTLCWLHPSQGFLHLLCGAGAFLSFLLILGLAPAPVLFLLWVLYLSVTTVSHEFMSFQWDALLLETGFLAIFLAPLSLRSQWQKDPPPSPVVLWLLRLLLFRLTFSSGMVKLLSGDPTWRNFMALTVHYETQPLPTWIGWYIHQLPLGFHKASCLGMFVVELMVPLLIFAPRRLRLIGCAAMVGFQMIIMATGNYCFFNLLTIALCLLLLDDAVWLSHRPFVLSPSTRLRAGLSKDAAGESKGTRRWPNWILVPVSTVLFLTAVVQWVGTLRLPIRFPKPIVTLTDGLAPFEVVNRYGLFAVMTTSRPEIILEGSRDGVTWEAYEFKFKPGDPMAIPRFVAPYQPRLDWQMWFAALSDVQENPWFINLCVRLLQGSPEVLALLKKNPFPQAPPRYIRGALYDYRFTDLKTRHTTGAWWRREPKGLYCPALSLREGKS